MANSGSFESSKWKQSNGTYRYFTVNWAVTGAKDRTFEITASVHFSGSNYQWVKNNCNLYLWRNGYWEKIASATYKGTYNGERCNTTFNVNANVDGLASISLKVDGKIYDTAVSGEQKNISVDDSRMPKVTINPEMSVISFGSSYSEVWATCKISNYGSYGAVNYVESDYKKTATLMTDNEEKVLAESNFTSNQKVSFNVGTDAELRQYVIKFDLVGPEHHISAKTDTISTTYIIKPDSPSYINLSCYNEDYTIASCYKLEWGWDKPYNSGSDIGEKFYRLDLWCTDINDNIKYINLNDGTRHNERQPYDTDRYEKFSDCTEKDIPSGTFMVGDHNIGFGVYAILVYDKWYYNSRTENSIDYTIQDDQAKVYLPEVNAVGKVWVLDESISPAVWKKAKKIFVDTSTSSTKNWVKHKNPTN